MTKNSLVGLYVDELRDIYNAEKQLTKALPKMAKASEPAVNDASRWRDWLKKARKSWKTTSRERCWMRPLSPATQRVEHYEIAAYGTLCAFADLLGESQHASLLRQTVDEEKATDERLTELSPDVNLAANDYGASQSEDSAAQTGKRGLSSVIA